MACSTGWPRWRTVSSRSRKNNARSRRFIGNESRKCISTATAPPGSRMKTAYQNRTNKNAKTFMRSSFQSAAAHLTYHRDERQKHADDQRSEERRVGKE